MKKKIITLSISLTLISLVTLSVRFIYIENYPLKLMTNILLNYLNATIALAAMKLTGMKFKLNINHYKQYLIGIAIALGLSLCIAVIPALCGMSLVGNHVEMPIYKIIINFFYYILVIGAVEELVFRVYIQDTLVALFNKNKWIGVIIASFLFGVWHIINGSLIQVLFTFILGLVWGFSKYFIKRLDYSGLALSHGLYDFLILTVTIFVVR